MDPSDQDGSEGANVYVMGIATEIEDPENPPHDMLAHTNVMEAGNLMEVAETSAGNMHSIHVAPLDTVAYQDVYYEEILTTSPTMVVHVQLEDHTIQTEDLVYSTIQTESYPLQPEVITVQANDHTVDASNNTIKLGENIVKSEQHTVETEDYNIQTSNHMIQVEDNMMQAEIIMMPAEDGMMPVGDGTTQVDNGMVQTDDGTMESDGGGVMEADGGGAMEADGGGAMEADGGGAMEADGGGAMEADGGGAMEADGGGAMEADGGGAMESDGGGAMESEGALPADGEGALPADGEGALPADGEGALPADGEGTFALQADEGGALQADEGGALQADEGGALQADEAGALQADEGGALQADEGGAMQGEAIQSVTGAMEVGNGAIQMEGGTIQTDYMIHTDYGTILAEGGTIVAEGGTILAEGGAVQAEDGAVTILTECGAILAHGGFVQAEHGAVTMLERVVQAEDRALQAEDGMVQPENGRVQPENGRVQPENGRVQPENGAVQPEHVAVQPEDINVQFRDDSLQREANPVQTVNNEVVTNLPGNDTILDEDNAIPAEEITIETVENVIQNKRKLPLSTDEPAPKRKKGRKKKGTLGLSHGGVSEDITLPLEALTDPDVELGLVKPKKTDDQSQTVLSTLSSMSLELAPPNSQETPAQDDASAASRTTELGSESADLATPPPVKVYKKRGRKSKAELMMIRLAQGLDKEPEKPTYIKKLLEEPDVLEMTPGGRPQRRAAKAAMVYLQELAAELTSSGPLPAPASEPHRAETTEAEPEADPEPEAEAEAEPEAEAEAEAEPDPEPRSPVQKKRGRKKKKTDWDEDDVSQDADFVLSEELLKREDDEILEDENDLFNDGPDPEMKSLRRGLGRSSLTNLKFPQKGTAPNGLPNTVMLPIWKCSRVTMEHREEHHSPWEFPEWVPSSTKWTFLTDSEASDYMPQEVKSPLFTIRREGLREEGTFYRLNRFHCLHPHDERWDMTFFVGGPVWSLDWCPTPDGSAASQYVALYCNMGMDDKHDLNEVYQGSALLQLWNLGPLQHEICTSTKATMTYGIALDHGCIWDLKFCPSGAWELPSTKRKNPQMPRLGLLAVAFSSGFVEIYSLPHSESLHAYKQLQVKDPFYSKYTICKVQCVATLNVGSIQASSAGECGQCFTVAWLPSKPHHHLAAGFYDGTVAMWDLSTKSLLQRVRYADGLIKLYPYNCFTAHDHAVKSIEWCKVNCNFLVTAGRDRKIKFWDLRRLYEPLNSIKRFLSTEITWILPYSGVAVAQDSCYASYGLCGIHFLDTGCLGYKAYYIAPRKGTVWSISGSDWLNSIVAGDVTGEVIAAILPDLTNNPSNIKRPSERRFPIYKAELLQCSALADPPNSKPAEEEQHDTSESAQPAPVDRSYQSAITKYSILYQDTDMTTFKQYLNREPMKRMWHSESKGDLIFDRMLLESVHKVRFNPNLDAHAWLVSGGQAGLVRVHCMRGLSSHVSRKLVMECQAQFSTMQENEMQDEAEYIPEVGHSVVQAE
ncbi:general transcription factor 3C polypeptide 2 [Pleurodeles waltl]|uniref:general transcription factor 3C polypeptide 2 n=1 Tax=Pleurodeles waltl TaxID=8319 RepID=UPI003709AD53